MSPRCWSSSIIFAHATASLVERMPEPIPSRKKAASRRISSASTSEMFGCGLTPVAHLRAPVEWKHGSDTIATDSVRRRKRTARQVQRTLCRGVTGPTAQGARAVRSGCIARGASSPCTDQPNDSIEICHRPCAAARGAVRCAIPQDMIEICGRPRRLAPAQWLVARPGRCTESLCAMRSPPRRPLNKKACC